MRLRDKEKLTRDAVVAKIRDEERRLADGFVNLPPGSELNSLNTRTLWEHVGALKALRDVLYR